MAKVTITITFTDDKVKKGLIHNKINLKADPEIVVDDPTPAQISGMKLMQIFADGIEGEDEDE